MLLAVLGWFFVALTGAVVVNGLIGAGTFGDVVIFGLFFIVLLMIAAAETHGLWLMKRGSGSRRLIFTTQGVEVINPLNLTGITSYEWEETDRIDIAAGKRGGVYIQVFTLHATRPSIRVVSSTANISPEQVRYEIDRLRDVQQE